MRKLFSARSFADRASARRAAASDPSTGSGDAENPGQSHAVAPGTRADAAAAREVGPEGHPHASPPPSDRAPERREARREPPGGTTGSGSAPAPAKAALPVTPPVEGDAEADRGPAGDPSALYERRGGLSSPAALSTAQSDEAGVPKGGESGPASTPLAATEQAPTAAGAATEAAETGPDGRHVSPDTAAETATRGSGSAQDEGESNPERAAPTTAAAASDEEEAPRSPGRGVTADISGPSPVPRHGEGNVPDVSPDSAPDAPARNSTAAQDDGETAREGIL